MILTNKYNVPDQIVAKIKANLKHIPYDMDSYDEVTFRTTEVLGPPLIKHLWDKYKDTDDLILDASDFLTVMLGHEIHKMFEGTSTDTVLYEYPVQRTFNYEGQDVIVFGTIDELEILSDSIRFTDNKTCLMSNLNYAKPEYEEQLNNYLLLCRNKIRFENQNLKLRLRYFIKDFTPSKKANAIARAANPYTLAKAKDMPDCAIITKNIPIYSEERALEIIMRHIADHLETPERPCTFDERWDTANKVAVMLTGRKSAKKLCSDKIEANTYMVSLSAKDKAKAYLEDRPAKPYERNKNCQYYCKARSVCPFAKSMGYKI